jgi:hypothetical protein
VVLRSADDPNLPDPIEPGATQREATFGVRAQADLDAIAAELDRSRSADENALGRRFDDTNDALARLRQRVDAIHSVDQEDLERRFRESDDALASLAQRLDGHGETLGELERTRALENERLEHRMLQATDALAALSERLFACGVLPYYLHLLDRVRGTAHYEVPEAEARALVQALAARLPGYLVPRLVREIPGELSKTPIV